MTFELQSVVPWGRTLEEYQRMFRFTEKDLLKKIISFGDGPASFNSEMLAKGNTVISIDPVYAYSRAEIEKRILETKETIIDQINKNEQNFVWDHIRNVDELVQLRMTAMQAFLGDFEQGKKEQRYIAHSLPDTTTFKDNEFDLGLNSHFLVLYSKLGLDFHLAAITEMLRVCKEVRIFPLVDLDTNESEVLPGIIDAFNNNYLLSIEKTGYEFQKGGSKMLRIMKDEFLG